MRLTLFFPTALSSPRRSAVTDPASGPANQTRCGPPVTAGPAPPRRRAAWAGRVLGVLGLLLVVLAAGAAPSAQAEPVVVLAAAQDITTVLTNVRNWIMGILALLATVFLTVGAVRYMWAGGDPGEISKAKTAFSNAAFGFALAALAPLVVKILTGIVGGL